MDLDEINENVVASAFLLKLRKYNFLNVDLVSNLTPATLGS
ncbi:hypothetical protein J2S21_000321 [Peribacillus cavernae]|nr:hypothetical protein [Peribacillus cavernae]